jgi:N-acetyl-gamma-glutamyl-phosphate reductase
LSFVPHSGPFARGIHATIFMHAKQRASQAQVDEALREFYKHSAFVRVDDEPPKMKDIAATSYAALHAVVQGDTIVVCSVADNLLKGAASGSLQWANRLLGFAEATGLTIAPAGWL